MTYEELDPRFRVLIQTKDKIQGVKVVLSLLEDENITQEAFINQFASFLHFITESKPEVFASNFLEAVASAPNIKVPEVSVPINYDTKNLPEAFGVTEEEMLRWKEMYQEAASATTEKELSYKEAIPLFLSVKAPQVAQALAMVMLMGGTLEFKKQQLQVYALAKQVGNLFGMPIAEEVFNGEEEGEDKTIH